MGQVRGTAQGREQVVRGVRGVEGREEGMWEGGGGQNESCEGRDGGGGSGFHVWRRGEREDAVREQRWRRRRRRPQGQPRRTRVAAARQESGMQREGGLVCGAAGGCPDECGQWNAASPPALPPPTAATAQRGWEYTGLCRPRVKAGDAGRRGGAQPTQAMAAAGPALLRRRSAPVSGPRKSTAAGAAEKDRRGERGGQETVAGEGRGRGRERGKRGEQRGRGSRRRV